ncbi:Rab GDP dissociation inhibitor [Plasmodiophora brassicae]
MSESEARRAQAHPRPFRPPRYESPSKALYRLIVRHYPVSYQRLKKIVFDAKERVPDGPLGKIDDDGKLRKILAEMGKRKKIYRIKKTPPPDVDLTQPLPEQYLSHFCPEARYARQWPTPDGGNCRFEAYLRYESADRSWVCCFGD